MAETIVRSGTNDRDTGPLSRYWNAKNSDQLDPGVGLDIKKVWRTKVEQIKRVIITMVVLCILVTEIRHPAPNQKDSAGKDGTMPVTWAGNVSACLQESFGEILC